MRAIRSSLGLVLAVTLSMSASATCLIESAIASQQMGRCERPQHSCCTSVQAATCCQADQVSTSPFLAAKPDGKTFLVAALPVVLPEALRLAPVDSRRPVAPAAFAALSPPLFLLNSSFRI